MDLANQNQINNPLKHDLSYHDQSINSLNNEYLVQLDADTIQCLSTKKKSCLSITNEDENDMRMKNFRLSLIMIHCLCRTNFWY